MKNTSKGLATGCVLAMLSAPFSAQAASGEARLRACADAMIKDLGNEYSVSAEYNLNRASRSDFAGRRMGIREVFHLDARAAGSEKVLARYDCVVNARAQVITLTALPLSAADARRRANGSS